MASPSGYSEQDAALLAIDALRASHHPLACAAGRRAWPKVARYLRLDPKTLVALYANNLKNTYVCNYTPSEVILVTFKINIITG